MKELNDGPLEIGAPQLTENSGVSNIIAATKLIVAKENRDKSLSYLCLESR